MMDLIGEIPFLQVIKAIEAVEPVGTFQVGDQTYQANTESLRLSCFSRSTVCVACGLEGSRFFLCKNPSDSRPHLNLYAVENDEMVLMTKDHIVPVSRGGTDTLSNLRTMCSPCNHGRGNNQTLSLSEIRSLRKTECQPSKSRNKSTLVPADFRMPTHFLGSCLNEVTPNQFKSECNRYHIHLDVDTHEFALEYHSQGGGADLLLWDLVGPDLKALENLCLKQMKAHATDITKALTVKKMSNREVEKGKAS